MTDAIICDIDGTVAHHQDRNIYDESRVHEDLVDIAIRPLVQSMMDREYRVIFLTGRSDKSRWQTQQWLSDNLEIPITGTPLLMRKKGDKRKSTVVKRELYNEHVRPYFRVLFVLDDRDQDVGMWTELGLKTLHVRN